jgi:tRNA dimethylallyltransferase
MVKIIVVCGPTAAGKSSLAIALAERLNTVILSADSRQVYQDFNIGTAKPSLEEQAIIPHYLIDICDPTETLTVAEYQSYTYDLIDKLAGEKPLLLVGGTGLYIKAVVRGLQFPRVAPQPALRSQLMNLGQSQCYAMLQQVDPQAVKKIHAQDQVRTLRALEVYYVTGLPMSEQQGENPPNYQVCQIGLRGDRPVLNARINQRTQMMIEMGLVDEVKFLIEKYGVDLPLLNTLGYGEIKQYLAGVVNLDEAIDLISLHTRQFAKRQMTWFQAVNDIQWFDVGEINLLDQVWECVQKI